MPQPATIQLISPDGRTTAVVEPGSGGRLVSLVVDGHEVIATCTPPYDADYFRGSFPLAPWCSLLPDGIVEHEGVRHQVPEHQVPKGRTYYHGAVHSWPFTVVEQTPSLVRQEIKIGPDQPEGWPWPGVVRHDYRLTDDRLEASLSVHSDGPEFPASAGFHPWFVSWLDDDHDRPAEVDFRPGRELHRGTERRREPGPVGENLGSGLFIEVESAPRISWPGGPSLELISDAPVWTTYDRTPGGFCIEPWTAPDGPLVEPYARIVTPDAPCVCDFAIKFGYQRG